MRTKMIRFNSSGRAVTGDMLLQQDDNGKLAGKGKWNKWLSEAVLFAAFAKGPARQVAKNMAVWGKRSHASALHA